MIIESSSGQMFKMRSQSDHLRIKTAFILAIIAVISTIEVSDADSKLRLVSVLFRHGARTPINNEMYPTDPNKNFDFSIFGGLAQLTTDGKNSSFILGQFLRKRYDAFLPSIYTPDIVEARSSDFPRTKETLKLVLSGLFAPDQNQVWHEDSPMQNFQTTFVPYRQDYLLSAPPCERTTRVRTSILNSAEIREKVEKEFQPFMDKLTTLTGKNFTEFIHMSFLYELFTSETYLNLPIPDWAKEIFPHGQLLRGALFSYYTDAFNDELKMLWSGVLVKKMMKDMASVRNGFAPANRKLHLYSAHDATIVFFLKALGFVVTEIPGYSTAVIVELVERGDKEFFVEIFYKNGELSKADQMTIPGCETSCPLDRLIELTKNVQPEDEEHMCD